jgi:crotonobetainyl-CoA:carnitine CoA-transferase CaiB-like acyl-CoA transferase
MLQALSDPQTIAREMVVEVQHPSVGPVKALGLPIKFSKTPGGVRKAAPLLGEDTREVLRQHGFSDEEIAGLEANGSVTSNNS